MCGAAIAREDEVNSQWGEKRKERDWRDERWLLRLGRNRELRGHQ